MSKLKIFTLLGTIGLLSFSCFSSAGNVSVSNGSTINLNDQSFGLNSAICSNTEEDGDFFSTQCSCTINLDSDFLCSINYYLDSDSVEDEEYVPLQLVDCPEGDISGTLSFSDCDFSSVSISVSNPPSSGGGETGGETGGNDNSLISSFTPVITGLTNAIKEFIPYVVFVGVGVISALLGFVAIKWLINRIRRKTLSPFK